MSEETPGSTGGEDATPPPEQPTQPPEQPTEPTEAATPAPASATAPAPAGAKEPFRFEVPRWAAVVVAAALLLGVGFAIGWIAAPGGGHDEIPIGGRVFPGLPGGRGGLGGGQGPATQVPGSSNGAFLGVSTQAASSGQQGVPVASVQTGSPADQAGLKVGDVITAVDGNSVTDPSQLSQDIRSHQPGDQVTITYTRSGTSAQAQVKLGSRAPVQIG